MSSRTANWISSSQSAVISLRSLDCDRVVIILHILAKANVRYGLQSFSFSSQLVWRENPLNFTSPFCLFSTNQIISREKVFQLPRSRANCACRCIKTMLYPKPTSIRSPSVSSLAIQFLSELICFGSFIQLHHISPNEQLGSFHRPSMANFPENDRLFEFSSANGLQVEPPLFRCEIHVKQLYQDNSKMFQNLSALGPDPIDRQFQCRKMNGLTGNTACVPSTAYFLNRLIVSISLVAACKSNDAHAH